MLDDKVREFAKNYGVSAVFRNENGGVTYCFITDFGRFNEFKKEELFRFHLGLRKSGVDIKGVLFTVLPIKNPEKYRNILGERIY